MTHSTHLHHRNRKFWTRVEIARSNSGRPRIDHRASIFWPAVIAIIAAAIIAGSMVGCKSGHSSKNINLTGELIPQIGVLIETSIPDAGPVGKVNLPKALDKTKEAAVSNRKAGEEFAALDAEFTKFKADPYVKAGLFVKRIVFWLKMLAGGAIVGAIVFGYVKGGAWGAVHTLTLGGTWLIKFAVGLFAKRPIITAVVPGGPQAS